VTKRNKARIRRKNNPARLLCTLLVLCSVLVWGFACSNQTAPAKPAATKVAETKQPAAQEKSETAKKDAAAENASPAVPGEFTYNAAGKPDPFEPLVTDIIVAKKSADETSPEGNDLPPLQKYDLSELKLVAIIVGDNNARFAMVEDKSGYGYILQKGMLVGKHNGVIQLIDEDSVVIKETLADTEGKEETNTTTLTIYKSEAGEQ
jgi:type IV pilus assembly protein PilP